MEEHTPSGFLFTLSKLSQMSTEEVTSALEKLDAIYREPTSFNSARSSAAIATITTPGFRISSVPSRLKELVKEEEAFIDSGYASAEEDIEEVEEQEEEVEDVRAEFLSDIRNDAFEKDFTIRWLTGFIARSSIWSCPLSPPLSDEEVGEREDVVDKAASLLTVFSATDEEEAEVALTRRFEFEVGRGGLAGMDEGHCGDHPVVVELNDEPLSSTDHSSVGLQSWASSIVLAKLMCVDPQRFGFKAGRKEGDQGSQRILELGAGTGLLSIAVAKLFDGVSCGGDALDGLSIVATDYHADVLHNLRRNVETNFPGAEGEPVAVTAYDWQFPSTNAPFDQPFDVIHAADVIYNEAHATWIKACVERLLCRPSSDQPEGGVFWLIMPIRTTGRHEGMDRTVLDAFSLHEEGGTSNASFSLKIVEVEAIERSVGVGRADESMYKLFKIRWV
ncbi:hypothetical protein SCHPADRAFT_897874 [Schizopora paradoxa]|uniref:S-adenosyl-L-methionine-dependent methyltransferase n=1 Tax=Schizopora paradoxa TaxID=27342 RepID=A0A0H2S9R5_9AGAM|nr:hypothetical protein SCHPADRAFT_897874 [Schizopora paradoxa]